MLLDAYDMFQQAVAWASADGALLVWLGIWGVLFVSGLGVPLPEDIPLTLTGFLTFQCGFFGGAPDLRTFVPHDFLLAFLYVTSAILAGDSCCWWLGRKWGMPLRNRVKLFKRIMTDKRIALVNQWFTKFGGATVFFGRQLAGVRFVTFFTAGTVNMRWSRFIIWDGLGALVSVPLWMMLGALGSNYQEDLRDWIANTGVGVLIVSGLVIAGFVIYVKYVWLRKRNQVAPDAAVPAPPQEVTVGAVPAVHGKSEGEPQ